MARGSRKPRVAIHEVESKQFGSEIKNCGSTGNIVNLFFFQPFRKLRFIKLLLLYFE